jgi:2-polyprenyl-6-methoxyphenol hydroxylase-like FAD-dependent oxidoreductase
LIRTGIATRNHAIVIGGGLAGLLTARVLSGHFGEVTLVDRDVLPQSEPRKGVPQGQHVHALLSKGQEILSQLFPDLMPALIAGGAVLGRPASRAISQSRYSPGHSWSLWSPSGCGRATMSAWSKGRSSNC